MVVNHMHLAVYAVIFCRANAIGAVLFSAFPPLAVELIGAVLGLLSLWSLYVVKNRTVLRHFSKRSVVCDC